MDGALDEFRPATKRQPYFVVGRDKPARAEPHEFAESSDARPVQLQHLLPAHCLQTTRGHGVNSRSCGFEVSESWAFGESAVIAKRDHAVIVTLSFFHEMNENGGGGQEFQESP